MLWSLQFDPKGLYRCLGNDIITRNIQLADLFLLFIYTEIVGMVGAYYISNRIPVTLPIIIAMTVLCRLIILHKRR